MVIKLVQNLCSLFSRSLELGVRFGDSAEMVIQLLHRTVGAGYKNQPLIEIQNDRNGANRGFLHISRLSDQLELSKFRI